MRSVVPDEKTRYTNLDTMGTCCSIIWLIVMLVFLFIALLFSFAPPTTSYHQFASKTRADTTSIAHYATINHFSSLGSYSIQWIQPIAHFTKETTISVDITATIKTFGQGKYLDSKVINISNHPVKCGNECESIIIGENSWINFQEMSIYAIMTSSFAELEGLQIKTITLYPFVAIIAFVVISAFTIVVSIFMLCCISRTLHPTRPDHWATLLLGLGLFFIDGPWLILKYYTPRVASQIFDLMPEIFHIFYIIVFTYFVAYRSIGFVNKIFGSWILRGSIISGLFILVVLQFVITKLMPLSTLSIYIKESKLMIPFSVIAIVFHFGILVLMIFGIQSLQIEKFFVMVVTSMTFVLLQGIEIIKTCIRIWIPLNSAGVSFSADVFYIVMANMVTLYFMMVNLPTTKYIEFESTGFEKAEPELKEPMLDSQEDLEDQDLSTL